MTLLGTYKMNPDEQCWDIVAIKKRMEKFGFYPVVVKKTFRELHIEGREGNRYTSGPVRVVYQYNENKGIYGRLMFVKDFKDGRLILPKNINVEIQEAMITEFEKPI